VSRPPEVVIVGAMKCGTSALHHHLGLHPDVAMAPEKEVNLFSGAQDVSRVEPATWWSVGQWHRGASCYDERFDPRARLDW